VGLGSAVRERHYLRIFCGGWDGVFWDREIGRKSRRAGMESLDPGYVDAFCNFLNGDFEDMAKSLQTLPFVKSVR
jgi:hypothetical protein